MRNTGILIFLVGIYIVINSGSLRDLVFGRAKISFLSPSESKGTTPNVNEATGFDLNKIADPANGGRNDGGK